MKRKTIFLSLSIVIILTMVIGLTASIAQAPAQPQVELGEPGLSYRYVETYGETQVPYLADTDHLNGPVGLFMDDADNLFVTEEFGLRVLRYDSTPSNVWALGKVGVSGTENYLFSHPSDVALDNSGNPWVADNYRIVQYDPDGIFLQQLPVDDPWNPGDDNTHFSDAEGIAFDHAGHLFVSDASNQRVQVYDLTSGSPVYNDTIGITGEAGDDNEHFNGPNRITVDSVNRLYITDTNNSRIQKCIYGVGWACAPLVSGLNLPQGITVDSSDNVYIADSNNGRVLKCTADGNCADFITNTGGFTDLAVDSSGNLYVTNQWGDSTVSRFDSSGQWLGLYVGVSGIPYLTDNYHYYRGRVHVDLHGNILISEEDGQRLLKLDPDGNFLWSVGEAGVRGGDNNHLSSPEFVATDSAGNVYVADNWNSRIQIFAPDGSYLDTLGEGGGTGDYQFNNPFGLAIGDNGNIYVADQSNDRVMIYDHDHTFIGQIGETGICGSDNDHLCQPQAVAVDSAGNIYVADTLNTRLVKFNSDLQWQSTIGGLGNQFDQLNWPNGVAVDDQGRIFISDNLNARIEVFDETDAYLTTIGGSWGTSSSQFIGTFAVALDPLGNVYISDWGNYRIQKYARGVPGWTQVNLNGFGAPTTVSASLRPFNGQLYAGAGDFSNGAQIWRTSDGTTWNLMTSPGEGIGAYYGVIVGMIEFDGQLFAGTGWSGEQPEIWSSPNGLDWTQVFTSTISDASVVQSFGVYGGQIYAAITTIYGTETGLAIYRSDTGAPGSWTPVVLDGNGDVHNKGVMDFAVFNDRFYAVGANEATGAFVWQASEDGSTWTQVNTPGFDDTVQDNAESIAVFNGALYVGTQCLNSPCVGDYSELWKSTNGTDWSLVTTGFENTDYADVTSLYAFDDVLFAVVASGPGGNTVWRSFDGSSWQQVNIGGWGDSNNQWSFWDYSITSFNNNLYIGSTNWASGAEIWRFTRQLFIPILRK